VAASKELVLSTKWTSQPEPIEAQDALQMHEQHFDLLPFTARPDIGIGLRDVARNVSGLFVDRTRDLAGRHFRTTPRLQFASIAVILAGAVEQCCPSFTRVPVELSTLPAGQT
jgi:hypothetical protein